MAGLLDINNGRIVSIAIFYKVSALLGAGRFAEVYQAYDTRTHTDVALKIYTGFDPESHGIAKNEESTLGRLASLNSEYFPKLRRSLKERIQNHNHPLLVMELGAYVATEGEKSVVCLQDDNYIVNIYKQAT